MIKKLLYILILTGLFISCSPTKRIQRLAEKHGELVKDTLHVDTNFIIPELNQDTIIGKEPIIFNNIDSSFTHVDTTNIVLEDGTKVEQVTETTVTREPSGLQKLESKTNYSFEKPADTIPIKLDLPFDKIVVEPPSLLDQAMDNIKWLALGAFSILLIFIIIKKALS